MATTITDEARSIAWIQSELERSETDMSAIIPPLVGKEVSTTSLCEYVRDGRALCLLASALMPVVDCNSTEPMFSKKLERSMNQLSTFHSLERIQFFIKWCRNIAKLDEHCIFTSVQLLDEVNVAAVGLCIDTLRTRFRPEYGRSTENDPVEEVTPPTRHTKFNLRVDVEDDDSSQQSNKSSGAASASKLNAFLSKFPSDTPLPTTTKNRPTSVTKANAFGFSGGVRKERSATSLTSEHEKSSTKLDSPSTSPSGRSKLQSATVPHGNSEKSPSPTKSTSNPSAQRKSISKLELPISGEEENNTIETDEAPKPMPLARSISKLQIPAAFSSASTTPSQPSPKTTLIPSSPRSTARLEIPTAFSKGSSTPSPKTSPTKSSAKSGVTTLSISPSSSVHATGLSSASLKRDTTLEKRGSKLAAFLSTVEAVNQLTVASSEEKCGEDLLHEVHEVIPDKADIMETPLGESGGKLSAFLSTVEPPSTVVDENATEGKLSPLKLDGAAEGSLTNASPRKGRSPRKKSPRKSTTIAEQVVTGPDCGVDKAITTETVTGYVIVNNEGEDSSLHDEHEKLKEKCTELVDQMNSKDHAAAALVLNLREEITRLSATLEQQVKDAKKHQEDAVDLVQKRLDEKNVELINVTSELQSLRAQCSTTQDLLVQTQAQVKDLTEQLEMGQRLLQQAIDSEQAARYSAQQAFAARDAAIQS